MRMNIKLGPGSAVLFLLFILTFCIARLVSGQRETFEGTGQPIPAPTPITTNWSGHPMVSDGDKTKPSQGFVGNVQIGFRSDGVVVFRTNSHAFTVWRENEKL